MNRALLFGALLALSCAPRSIESPPPAPSRVEPEQAIPADLDVVLRVDLKRMRAGSAAGLEGQVKQQVKQGEGDGALLAALGRADVAWFAFRPRSSEHGVDNVVVLEGNFAQVEPTRDGQGWSSASVIGGPWRLYEREPTSSRSAAVRLYTHGEELWVFVSHAEIDAVERVIERGAREPHPVPPKQGLVSLAARMPGLAEVVRETSPSAARLLGRGRMLTAHFDVTHAGLSGAARLEFVSQTQAERAERAAELLASAVALQGGTGARIAKALTLDVVDDTVSVHVELSADELAQIMACADGRLDCS